MLIAKNDDVYFQTYRSNLIRVGLQLPVNF